MPGRHSLGQATESFLKHFAKENICDRSPDSPFVFQSVFLLIWCLMSRFVPYTLAKRLTTLPDGVVSKNIMGTRRMLFSSREWRIRDALIEPLARSRVPMNTNTPVVRRRDHFNKAGVCVLGGLQKNLPKSTFPFLQMDNTVFFFSHSHLLHKVSLTWSMKQLCSFTSSPLTLSHA
jgi:hypothetical protein